MDFLNILNEAEIHTIPESLGKNKHSKVMGFSNSLGEAENHTIPKMIEK